MYKITLYIYPISDCGEDLIKGEPIEISYEGTDLYELKKSIDNTIVQTMKTHNTNDGEVFVELAIEKNGEYYDHDEATVFVDLQNNTVKFKEYEL